jgi:hypothetical protein
MLEPILELTNEQLREFWAAAAVAGSEQDKSITSLRKALDQENARYRSATKSERTREVTNQILYTMPISGFIELDILPLKSSPTVSDCPQLTYHLA